MQRTAIFASQPGLMNRKWPSHLTPPAKHTSSFLPFLKALKVPQQLYTCSHHHAMDSPCARYGVPSSNSVFKPHSGIQQQTLKAAVKRVTAGSRSNKADTSSILCKRILEEGWYFYSSTQKCSLRLNDITSFLLIQV